MASMTIAVTGIASGIGAELAAILAARDHRVIGFDIREPDATPYRYIPLDLSDPDQVKEAAAQVGEPLDGLCNNAGLPPREGWEAKILQVNYLSQKRFTAALLPALKPGASIVNTASRAGHGWRDGIEQICRLNTIGSPADLERFVESENLDAVRAYNLSKEAVIAWTIAESEPMIARGLRMNSLSPGAVATGILDDFARAFGERMARNVERAGRPGTPREVAEIAAFLLSPESGWIKGNDIPVDGGMGGFAVSDALGLDQLTL